ncbi:MAG: hypothetical protein HC859_17250 [Bacteroidia bacterium]|nr:hypothetical protein [Bacteroidia bacterium]
MALPLCLGVSLASGAPVYTGLVAGVVGGILIPLISKSALSVSGPAAGLTAVCATAIGTLGSLNLFFLSVSIAGLLQVFLGMVRLGGFTHLSLRLLSKGCWPPSAYCSSPNKFRCLSATINLTSGAMSSLTSSLFTTVLRKSMISTNRFPSGRSLSEWFLFYFWCSGKNT